MKKSLQFVILALLAISVLASQSEAAPKNVIVMISDGMGFQHSEAASLYRYGYSQGQIYWQFTQLAAKTNSLSTAHGYDESLAYKDFRLFQKRSNGFRRRRHRPFQRRQNQKRHAWNDAG